MILEGLVGAGIMFFGMTAGWVMNNVAHTTNDTSKKVKSTSYNTKN